ncbi:MAG TPA: hypothetical protein VFA11_10155 [Acidimicrobiales bacterium]|nr:hypothetical protein [Acidimicrobiales bacterium]
MTDTPPITQPHPRDLSLVLSYVRLEQWGAKARLVELVRAETIDVGLQDSALLLSWRDVAAWFDLSLRSAGKHLGALVADRVLICRESAGSRARAYAISGAFARWLNVPWRIDQSEVLTRVQAAAFAAEQRAAALDSARSHRRALAPFVSRSQVGASARPERLASRFYVVRGARNGAPSARPWERAEISGEAAAPQLPGSLTPHSLGREGAKNLDQHQREALNQLQGAILAATGRTAYGGPGRRLAAVAAAANGNLGRLVELARSGGAGTVQGIVELLEAASAAEQPSAPAGGADRVRAAKRAALERRRAGLLAAGASAEEIQAVEQELGTL